MRDVSEIITELAGQVADLRRRIDQGSRRGKVHDIRKGGNEIRVSYGKDDQGNDILSPWVPVSGGNGASAKTRHAYKKGEHVITSNPGGDWEGAEVRPSNHTTENASPSTTEGEHVVHSDGKGSMTWKDGVLTIKSGGVTTTFNGSGWSTTGGTITHDGKSIGSNHTHQGVEPGGGNTGNPN